MFVSVTLLKLRSPLKLFPFMKLAQSTRQQAKSAPGNLLTATRGSLRLAFYTFTAWETEQDMRNYMKSGPHLDAMKRTRDLAGHLESTHFTTASLPTWKEAIQRLKADPRGDKSARYVRQAEVRE